MREWIKRPWAPVVLLVVVCVVLPLLLQGTQKNHVLIVPNSPYTIYCCFILPILSVAVCIWHMTYARRPALWLSLVMEILVVGYALVVKTPLFYAYDAPFVYYLLFYTIPTAVVFFGQIAAWMLIRQP